MTDLDLDGVDLSSAAARRLTERPVLTDDVHDVLVDMLMNHSLGPGARINIDGLARTLTVSPTPIREALARIEAEGLIVKEPRRGYVVAPLISREELRALIDFRLLIEPPAAAAAAERASTADASALQTFARSGGAGTHDGAAVSRLDMLYDARFHDSVASLGGNPWLRESLARLRSHLHMYRLYYHANQAAATSSEHIAIADAIADRDPARAADAMRRHLDTAMRRSEEVFASGRLPSPR
ncbi:MAG TPA: GntR family transcriptional regulator [Acidimicrobiales bacterium]|nr:GntR family transcriptional regulator [Acidimicrobiales bacterium]